MNRFNVNVIVSTWIQVDACSKDDAIVVAQTKIPNEISFEDKKIYLTIEDFPNVECLDIMDATNNHDAALVDRVNRCYRHNNRRFYDIVLFLAERDKDEFDFDIIPADNYDICRAYCTRIADNNDLLTIVNYCK